MTEQKCCNNCDKYINAQCDYLKTGLITQIRLENDKGQAVSNADFKIYHSTCITTEFSKMMKCNNWRARDVKDNND